MQNGYTPCPSKLKMKSLKKFTVNSLKIKRPRKILYAVFELFYARWIGRETAKHELGDENVI
jgi:hypothetical protein